MGRMLNHLLEQLHNALAYCKMSFLLAFDRSLMLTSFASCVLVGN